ncbi:iron chelate uptake ABC transporter family permease subunit [Sphingobacterium sp. lm-10]|uniref:ABC transporter permease n=1 Tax=Sphingobacterium sp. lm-10 TaxID=2944904 RepID=UPI002022043F|nr:iron chelate uptake ABC transporter family permease subunit [Sphingobacterium sp. lm-10]MCL7988201.1 iron chelate uptake ABC transporter family permease subunit [Sphingobacterium sp. lm-10]
MDTTRKLPIPIVYAGAIIALLALVWISLFTGVKDIAMRDVFAMTPDQLLVFTIARIPRAIALVLTGAGLSVAGFIMQQLSQNKFVSPTTAGSLEAAKMGILFSILLIPQASMGAKTIAALVFTLAASLLFMVMVRRVRFRSSVFIPLVGIMFGNILAAISTFFAFKHGIVQNVQEWMIGDFSSVLQGQYESIYLILPAVVLAYTYADRFTIVGMGASFAKNLGISYGAVVNLGLFAVSLTVSVSVVTAGAIPFLGLIVPNMVSMIMGDNLRRTLPMTALAGAVFLLFCDILGRTIIYPYEIPIGLMVGVIGGVIFLFLILRRNR